MIFSQRYRAALADGRIVVELSDEVRRKLWAQLDRFDHSFGVQRDPGDNWTDNTTALNEARIILMAEHGWDTLPDLEAPDNSGDDLRPVIIKADGPIVFDVVELYLENFDAREAEIPRAKINEIFEIHGCPWRYTDGEFFQLDTDFVGARIVDSAHEALSSHRFAGAANEFSRARAHLASGDAKDAILYACKSFESTLKALTGLRDGNADKLIKAFVAGRDIDDLPEGMRQGFGEQVLKTLPTMRNRLAGHGQGSEVVEVSVAYAELALQLAAAFQNFLIAKHLGRPVPVPTPASSDAACKSSAFDEVPF